MNSNLGETGSSLSNFEFDLGIGSNRSSQSLNDQKNEGNSHGSSYSVSGAKPGMGTAGTTPSWQPNKLSWTPQPAPVRTAVGARSELGGPTSMVGDIFGKSWTSTAPTAPATSVGVASKVPNLFGDLVSSALGQNKSGGSTPLKDSTPASAPAKGAFSMGSMSNSLPKGSGSGSGSIWGSSDNFGDFVGASSAGGGFSTDCIGGGRSVSGGGSGLGTSTNGDPFDSLLDIGPKPSGGASLNSASKAKPTSLGDWDFGDYQNASKSSATAIPPNLFPAGSNPAPSQPSGSDVFDFFFPSASDCGDGAKTTPAQSGNQQSMGGDDWGFYSEFGGGGNEMGSTTEIEGLPPPPAGVSASSAKSKGLDNYKQGQYADAIKWLSWAVLLLEKSGGAIDSTEVLTCRASCYKEVGEYKKAVADCTKILDKDRENVAVLVQRGLLYESMEKYKLGAEDLRTVMKLDPGNRVARSTIHRLTKMID